MHVMLPHCQFANFRGCQLALLCDMTTQGYVKSIIITLFVVTLGKGSHFPKWHLKCWRYDVWWAILELEGSERPTWVRSDLLTPQAPIVYAYSSRHASAYRMKWLRRLSADCDTGVEFREFLLRREFWLFPAALLCRHWVSSVADHLENAKSSATPCRICQ